MKQKLLSTMFALACITTSSYAQSRQVSGKVTSTDGRPVVGASVAVVGVAGSTQTDATGSFTLKAAPGATLNISYVGFTSQRVHIGDSPLVSVVLVPEDNALDEVVVVAYGTARKSEITGSVATMSSADLEKRTVTNVSNALAGLAPGISVGSGNGQPGSGSGIRLRGIGSMSASSAPLYVLNGAVFEGDLGDINPDDVESISVLKDATSAALYGSRAGNGVIMITTKKGKGAPKLSASFTQGISERGIKEYDRVGTFDYYPLVFQALKNSQLFPNNKDAAKLTEAEANQYALNNVNRVLVYNPFNVANNNILDANGNMNPDAQLKYDDFDWYSYMQRTGKRSDANISMSGSNEKSDYYASVGYLNDQGYLINSDFKRFNGRVNVNTQVKSWLRTGVNISAANSVGSLAADESTGNGASFVNPFNFIRGMGPIYPVHAFNPTTGAPVYNELTGEQYFDYGIFPGAQNRPTGASNGRNVVYETMLNKRENTRNVIGGRGFVEIKFLKNFTFTPSINVDVISREYIQGGSNIVGDGVSSNGTLAITNNTTTSYTFNQVLAYQKSFEKHNVSALAGHENYDYSFKYRYAYKVGQVTSGIDEFANYVTPRTLSGYRNDNKIESYFAKASYNYDQKYFFDGSFRRDGSSIFAKDRRWGSFYSLGGAWAVKKEQFMQDVTWVNDLRLKVSYGEVGNNNLLNTDGTRIYYGYQSLYDLGYNNGTLPGISFSTLANPDLTWETSKTFNVGVDFAVLDNRLRGEIEFYKRGSDQLLLNVPLPLSASVSSQFRNVGAMFNTGLEFSLTADIIRGGDFGWTMTNNISFFKNKITKMPVDNPVITTGSKQWQVGRDFYSFWLRQYVGVDPTDGSSLYLAKEGISQDKITTINGVDLVKNQNDAKFAYSGSAIPDFSGSIMNNFNYKSFSLSFLLTYQVGGKIYDSQYAGLMSTSSYGKAYHVDALKAWTTTNTTSDIPRLDVANSANINAPSTRWLIDASYISLRNVNLTYKLPSDFLNKVDMTSARVFFTGENLLLSTKRRGLNPTETFNGTNGTSYLPTRMFSLGVNVSF